MVQDVGKGTGGAKHLCLLDRGADIILGDGEVNIILLIDTIFFGGANPGTVNTIQTVQKDHRSGVVLTFYACFKQKGQCHVVHTVICERHGFFKPSVLKQDLR